MAISLASPFLSAQAVINAGTRTKSKVLRNIVLGASSFGATMQEGLP